MKFSWKGGKLHRLSFKYTKLMFEFTDPSLRGEVNSNMNLGVLELKLHSVHFADKFSGARGQIAFSTLSRVGQMTKGG